MSTMLSPYLQAAFLGLSIAVPIGPVNLEIMRQGLAGGFRRAFLVGAGASCIDGLYCALFVFGFATLVPPNMLTVLGYVGGSFLVWMGLSTLWSVRRPLALTLAEPETAKSPAIEAPFLRGLAMTAFNPPTIAFWSSVGVLAAAESARAGTSKWAFVACVTGGALVWVVSFSTALHVSRSRLSARVIRALTIAGGTGLTVFGVKILVEAIAP